MNRMFDVRVSYFDRIILQSENANNTAIVSTAPFQLQAYEIVDKAQRIQQQLTKIASNIVIFVVLF